MSMKARVKEVKTSQILFVFLIFFWMLIIFFVCRWFAVLKFRLIRFRFLYVDAILMPVVVKIIDSLLVRDGCELSLFRNSFLAMILHLLLERFKFMHTPQQSLSSPANMAEPASKKKISSIMPDWSQFPEELFQLISTYLESCFDVVHARSVCCSWRSSFPFPCCLLRPSYSLPSFADFPRESKDLCTLEKVPLFLFRVRPPPVTAMLPSEYFLGGIGRDKSEDCIELLPSPLQCSVKLKIRKSAPTFINMNDCQILPLGYKYRMIDWEPNLDDRGVALLPLNKEEGGGEFIVLLNCINFLLVLRSAEMRWMRLKQISNVSCKGVVTFRGRFYAVFLNGDVFVIDPYSLEVTPLMSSQPLHPNKYLIPSGNDELFLVEKFIRGERLINELRSECRVSRLDEEAGKWVEVSDLGDLILFVGLLGNVCCSAKELPDNCGVSGNSILFSNEPGTLTHFYKYGQVDDLKCWSFSRENRVRFLYAIPVVALLVECQA